MATKIPQGQIRSVFFDEQGLYDSENHRWIVFRGTEEQADNFQSMRIIEPDITNVVNIPVINHCVNISDLLKIVLCDTKCFVCSKSFCIDKFDFHTKTYRYKEMDIPYNICVECFQKKQNKKQNKIKKLSRNIIIR